MKKPFLYFIVCFCISAGMPVSVSSKSGRAINRYHYTVDDGLPSNEIYSVVQDKSGFIWFGTNNGLSRFDGKHFRNFRKNDGCGISGNNILGLVADSGGVSG